MAAKTTRKKRRKVNFPLKEVLASNGVSLAELSRRTKIPRPHLSALANGRAAPTWLTVLIICEAIGVSPQSFVTHWLRKKGIDVVKIPTQSGHGKEAIRSAARCDVTDAG